MLFLSSFLSASYFHTDPYYSIITHMILSIKLFLCFSFMSSQELSPLWPINMTSFFLYCPLFFQFQVPVSVAIIWLLFFYECRLYLWAYLKIVPSTVAPVWANLTLIPEWTNHVWWSSCSIIITTIFLNCDIWYLSSWSVLLIFKSLCRFPPVGLVG